MIYSSLSILSIIGATVGFFVAPWSLKSFFKMPSHLLWHLKVALLALPVAYGGMAFQSAFWLYLGLDRPETTSIKNDHLVLVLLTVSIIPIVEEIIFRGFLDELFKKYNQRKIGAYASSLIFGLCHPHFGATVPMGFILLYVRRRTNSLWSSILFHSTMNASAYLGITILSSIEDSPSEVTEDMQLIIWLLSIGILLVALGAKGFIKIVKSFSAD